jgi:hypothetical protein
MSKKGLSVALFLLMLFVLAACDFDVEVKQKSTVATPVLPCGDPPAGCKRCACTEDRWVCGDCPCPEGQRWSWLRQACVLAE